MRKFNLKSLLLALSLLLVMGFSSAAQAEWHHGIGTGFGARNYDGDIEFYVSGAPNDTVKLEVELEPDDFTDMMESAIGFAGYSTDGTWVIQYSLTSFELEETWVVPVVGFTTLNFEYFSAEATVGYNLVRSPSVVFGVLGGVRMIDHEYTARGVIISRTGEADWVDGLLGVTLNFPFTDKVSWNNRLDGGFGGSEGTINFATGIGWRFAKNWSTGFNVKYTAVEYEDGTVGNPNYYLYDVDETAVSVNIVYNW